MASQWLYRPTNHTKRTPVHRLCRQDKTTLFKGEFAVVPTDKIYHKKSPLIWTAYLWNCMSHDQRDQGHIPQKFEVVFVGFRLMKNIIFNKTEIFVVKNTNDHACQIFCSKSNCETMYHWFRLETNDPGCGWILPLCKRNNLKHVWE